METDYKTLIQQNAIIHAFMGRQPEEEYHVVTLDETGYVLSPKQHGYSWAPEQKAECDRWVAENKRGKEYKTLKTLNYPYYNQNWNELMPVVEAIEEIEEPHPSNNPERGTIWPYQIEILSRSMVQIIDNRNDEAIVTVNENNLSKIEAVYKAVLEFIRWYNSTTQNKELVDPKMIER